MDLKEFIKESLVQISQGIIEANEELKATDAIVNPTGVNAYSNEKQAYGRIDERYKGKDSIVHLVKFDVALHAESGAEGGGGVKLSIASVSFGVNGKTNEAERSESRLCFNVPMVYPNPKR